VSTPVESIWANPQDPLKYPQRLPELAEGARRAVRPSRAQALAARVEGIRVPAAPHAPETAQAIVKLGIPGVFSQREYRRFYPQGDAVAHVLGFTNIDDSGQEGLELAFDEWLRGTPGARKVIRDRRGRIVENVDLVRAALPGKDLTLSIDRRIQFLAYRELRNALLEKGASSGSAVVLDVATGEVLAMANLPSYNPNAVELGNREAHRNRSVTDLIEPGSTMKPITVAPALENHYITPQTSSTPTRVGCRTAATARPTRTTTACSTPRA
jgi:cell division protein FtsI (penicillin-binding protein 3)